MDDSPIRRGDLKLQLWLNVKTFPFHGYVKNVGGLGVDTLLGKVGREVLASFFQFLLPFLRIGPNPHFLTFSAFRGGGGR